MIASPSNLDALDIEREKQRLETALQDLTDRGIVTLTWLAGQTWRDLQRAMRGGPWHIFHFAGHGGFDPSGDEGLIALADDDGRTQYLRATQLGRLLANHDALRLVVLNACEGARGSPRDLFSSAAALLVQRGIPAVLAMQYEISDQAAVELTRAFYEALADGLPVDAAVTEPRVAVSLAVNNTVEWGTPVLYMRSNDGVLFKLAQEVREPRTEQPISQSQPGQKRSATTAKEPSSGGETSRAEPERDRPAPSQRALEAFTISAPIHPELVRVPAGEFLMGSHSAKDAGAFDDEQPQHRVYVAEFSIGKYPVTRRSV